MKHLKTYEQKNFDINKSLSYNGKELDVTGLNLVELPELPESLEYLFCANNKLTELPKLSKLKYLYCYNNNLKELPKLPKGLTHLCCGNNNLTELPELPDSLEYLDCEKNNLPYNDLYGYWEWFKEEHPDLWAAKQMGLY